MTTPFPYRRNSDGTIDFICSQCFATVATRWDDGSFILGENMHVCDPARLHDLNRDRGSVLNLVA
jgi:hypothetical protein